MMLNKKTKNTSLYCFSPPVMLATIVVEIGLLFYTIYKYKLDLLSRLVVVTLTSLAVFQISEYMVCGNVSSVSWSRVGFVAITTLPPLGLHILSIIITANKVIWNITQFAYATMTGLILYFLLATNIFANNQCTGNYVIFDVGARVNSIYTLYYYGLLFIALIFAAKTLRNNNLSQANIRQVKGLIIGYLVFLVPTAIVNNVAPSTIRGIPSIMCGFAVIFAVILVLYIAPQTAEAKDHSALTK